MTHSLVTVPSLAATLLLAGCAFTRTVANSHVRQFDTAFIQPGRTTVGQVLATLGPPPPLPEGVESPPLFADDYLRYVCYETRQTRLLFGYIVFFPFQWSDTQAVHERLITFGPDGTVRDVIRTERDTVRLPLESDVQRLPVRCASSLTKGGQP